ncbi:AAA family ATPase [Acetobacter musti]|uniref:DNA 5'-3' helicase n=1 Tax=Acetobacter musti TaxID=864732 RepID=A0ABX0JR42_9PROT|nr:DnaB-like helicase C-terminal domain-containing protein [Acetobacter musti]NHN85787.1 AAA family ATPase [Acetobacter musti]
MLQPDFADQTALRQMPSATEAEQALLGAILTQNRAYDMVSGIVSGDMFSVPAYGWIFDLCGKRIISGQLADPVTLRGDLVGASELDPVGGVQCFAALLNATVGVLNVQDYALAIRDAWTKRKIISLTAEASAAAFNPAGEETGEILHTLESGLIALNAGSAGKTLWSAADASDAAVRDAERAFQSDFGIMGASVGYDDLDDVLGGLEPGTFNVLAGRPGMGKTGLALGMAVRSAITSGKTTLYYSGEMSAKDLTRRLISAYSGVPASAIRRGGYVRAARYGDGKERVKLSQAEWDRIIEAQRAVKRLAVQIEQKAGINIPYLQSTARRIARQKSGLGLIVVDYLDLMRSVKNTTRQFEITTEISQGLLYTAKSLNVPMIVLQQLSREVEKRDDKRPVMADLRNSGQIEQDADSIMFVYREAYYLENEKPVRKPHESDGDFLDREQAHEDRLQQVKNLAEVLIRKNRHGETGEVKMRFDGPRTWFRGISEAENAKPW